MSTVTEDIIFLDRYDGTTCTIHLFGGTISSWCVRNKEILYLKQRTVFNNISSIRGGIKFCFPYIGRHINGPKHGFPSIVKWKLENEPVTLSNGDIEVILTLAETEYTKSIWCYKFKIINKLTLGENSLKTIVTVENTCRYFPFFFILSQYNVINVNDVRKCEILNLADLYKCSIDMKTKKENKTLELNNNGNIVIERKYEMLFIDTSECIELINIDGNDPELKLQIISKTTKDFLITNPWCQLDEFDVLDDDKHNPDEYLHFIGISTGNLSKSIRLEPKEKCESIQILNIIDVKWEKKMKQLTALLSNPWEMFKEKC